MRAWVVIAALMLGCTSGGKGDDKDTDTTPVGDDTGPVDTPDDTDPPDTDDSDPLDTDTPPLVDTTDSSAPDTFNQDTTFIPGDDTGETGASGETGDDEPPGPCSVSEVEDCDGECFPRTLKGDGVCHDGVRAGTPDFNCLEHNFDEGDCVVDTDTLPCGDPLDVRDCDGVCYPLAWIGDGSCDDGTSYAHGSPNFMCLLFQFDDGDCGP